MSGCCLMLTRVRAMSSTRHGRRSRTPAGYSSRKWVCLSVPEGYVEPRHKHEGTHSVAVLQGRVIAEGKELGPGGYVYGPSKKPHGPFEWHDDCIVFVHFEGDPVHHYKKNKKKSNR